MKNQIKVNCARDWWLVKLSPSSRVKFIEEHLPQLFHHRCLDTKRDLTDSQIVFIYEQETK